MISDVTSYDYYYYYSFKLMLFTQQHFFNYFHTHVSFFNIHRWWWDSTEKYLSSFFLPIPTAWHGPKDRPFNYFESHSSNYTRYPSITTGTEPFKMVMVPWSSAPTEQFCLTNTPCRLQKKLLTSRVKFKLKLYLPEIYIHTYDSLNLKLQPDTTTTVPYCQHITDLTTWNNCPPPSFITTRSLNQIGSAAAFSPTTMHKLTN